MIIEMVVCGFQTGADIAGARAAKAAGIKTSGWIPMGWKTEDGPRPEYAGLYGAMEHPSELFPPRTEANAKMADATIWFGSADSAGYRCTYRAAKKHDRYWLEIGTEGQGPMFPTTVADWIESNEFKSLNIAGTRESKAPGMEERVFRFLSCVFRILKEGGQ